MPNGDQEFTANLVTLARSQFGDFTQAERRLLRAAPKGEFAVCGPNANDQDPLNDPSKAEEWGEDRQIRADLIRWLCVDRHAKELTDPKGIAAYGAKITGSLDISYATVSFPLTLRHCRLTKDANLSGVEIPQLDLQDTFVRSVVADFAKVKGSIFLRNGFRADGKVSLVGAEIGGNLTCDGGTFENPPREKIADSGRALDAEGINVKGSVFLRYVSAEGEVRLLSAQIGGTLEGDGAIFKNASQERVNGTGFAVNADRISVNGGVFLRNGFTAAGAVRLPGARIGGDLDCGGGAFSELDAHTAAIKRTFYWFKLGNVEPAKLDLRNASAGSITDDAESWPAPGNLRIDGFVYSRISSRSRDAESRLNWLGRLDSFTPQPYRQLAGVLMEAGDEDGARKVLIEMERRQRAGQWKSPLLRWTIGYGYHPLWVVWWLLGFTGLAWIIFRRAQRIGRIAPTDEQAYRYFKANRCPPPHYTRFSPLIYALENLLPLIKLGQADKWQPDPDRTGFSWNVGKGLVRFWGLVTSPGFLSVFLWFCILLGWILATLFAAGITGIVHTH